MIRVVVINIPNMIANGHYPKYDCITQKGLGENKNDVVFSHHYVDPDSFQLKLCWIICFLGSQNLKRIVLMNMCFYYLAKEQSIRNNLCSHQNVDDSI